MLPLKASHSFLTPARGRYSIDLPQRDWKLSWPRWTDMVYPHTDGLPSKYYPSSTQPGVKLTICLFISPMP